MPITCMTSVLGPLYGCSHKERQAHCKMRWFPSMLTYGATWLIKKQSHGYRQTAQPKVKAIGELGDALSFSKYVNLYYADAKDFATEDTQKNYFPFEVAVAKRAPFSAYYRYHYSLPPALAQDFYSSVSSHALFLRGDVQVMPCDELRGESSCYVVPTRKTFRKHPGELLPWELVSTLVGQTKSLGVRISSTQVRGKFGIFCGLDISNVISTGSL